MIKKYEWASNIQKLVRAIGIVGESSEEALKAEYIKIGGLLVGGTAFVPALVVEASEPVLEELVAEGTPMPVVEKPKTKITKAKEVIKKEVKKVIKKKNAK